VPFGFVAVPHRSEALSEHTSIGALVRSGPARPTPVRRTDQQGGGNVMKVGIGGGMPTLLATGQGDPTCIAEDATSLYWTNYSGGEVMKLAK
jgi:hypothetical protein